MVVKEPIILIYGIGVGIFLNGLNLLGVFYFVGKTIFGI